MNSVGGRSIIGLLLLVFFAGACRTEQPTGAPEQPIRGGTLVIATGSVDLQNPAMSTGASKTRSTMLIYQGLVSLGADLIARPELAESFEPEEDGAVWRFSLREAQWHDGVAFTSADVKFTFEKLLLEFHPRTRQVLKPKLSTIETPDERTVIFRMSQPFSVFPQLLTVGDAPILPKHIFEGSDPKTNPANEKPVGTGPFKFVSYQKDAELRLARNDDYFREGFPYLNEVVYRVIPQDSSRLQALERGDVDVVVEPPDSETKRLESDSDFRVVATSVDPAGANCGNLMGFNLDRPLFGDPRMRRAIAHGIDRKRILDQLSFGYGRIHTSPLNSGIKWAHSKVDYPEFDAGKADELLTAASWVKGGDGMRVARGAAGVADGTPLRFELTARNNPTGALIREPLSTLGIEVVVVETDRDLSSVRIYEKREFDTFVATVCQGSDPELGLRRTIHSSAVIPVANTNGAGFKNPEVDSLMDEAAAEIDQKKRGRTYMQLQEILAREMPYVWLVEERDLYVHSASCQGIFFDSAYIAERAYCRS